MARYFISVSIDGIKAEAACDMRSHRHLQDTHLHCLRPLAARIGTEDITLLHKSNPLSFRSRLLSQKTLMTSYLCERTRVG